MFGHFDKSSKNFNNLLNIALVLGNKLKIQSLLITCKHCLLWHRHHFHEVFMQHKLLNNAANTHDMSLIGGKSHKILYQDLHSKKYIYKKSMGVRTAVRTEYLSLAIDLPKTKIGKVLLNFKVFKIR